VQRRIRTLFREVGSDAGASPAEYALLVITIALVMVIGAFLLGDALDARLEESATCVNADTVADCE